jgi:hypothetical protein
MLQVRQVPHGACAAGRHPAVQWLDERGISTWRGADARAVTVAAASLAQPAPSNGLGCALVEETSPAVHLLKVASCGLRDEGVPIGRADFRVLAYPASQWMFALAREAGDEIVWPAPRAAPPRAPRTRCRVERDGTPLDASRWARAFDETLHDAFAVGGARLFELWSAGVRDAVLRIAPDCLVGRAGITWGWRESAAGLAGEPLMRVVAELDLTCSLAIELSGEVDAGASRTRVRLAARGTAPLRASIARERAGAPLLAALAGAVARFRFPFEIEFDPVAVAEGVVWSGVGPCSGALVGEAGLRPRLQGGSGWQWYVRAEVEPVLVPVVVHDPVLGQTKRTLALLPGAPLVDWSLG